jgi:sigma-B regulation protein RsbU (phosphoserine phosphatase)
MDNFDSILRREGNSEQARLSAQRDLEIGRQIQASFLPKNLPQPDGWEIAAHFEAARKVAGDFYDAFLLSGGKRVGLVVGDVCDKGVGAALFMALFRSLIRAFAEQHYSLGWMDVLRNDADPGEHGETVARRRSRLSTGTTALKNAMDLTNAYIYRNHGDTSMFATIFFGVLDPSTGSLVYINGGHVPPLVIRPGGNIIRLNPTGPAVGLLPNLEFSIEQVELGDGDTLLIFTDGVTDALSPHDEFFSEEKLFSIAAKPATSAAALLEDIRSNLQSHIAGADQFDDITLLAARKNIS